MCKSDKGQLMFHGSSSRTETQCKVDSPWLLAVSCVLQTEHRIKMSWTSVFWHWNLRPKVSLFLLDALDVTKGTTSTHTSLFGGSGAVAAAACAFHTSVSSLLWAEAGKSWLGRGGRLTVVSISSAMTTSSKAIMERRVFFGVHLSLFNWLRFTEFAIWFIFPLTAQPRTAPALKAHHLVPHFKWVMLLLRGIRKMLDQLLENRECQLCILFLSECLDFKIYYCFNIYSMILIPKLPKRLSNSDSGDSSCVL